MQSSKDFERIVRLEEKVDAITARNDSQDMRIDKLNKELISGLKAQEDLLREMVSELKSQQQEMHIAYQRMSAFTKGVLWVGGIGAGLITFFIRYGDKLKDFIIGG